MENYKRFHYESSLSLENASEFSDVACWVEGMRNFSKELSFIIPEHWKKVMI